MTQDLPELRASDADRERVADRLRDALAEGRLDMDEFGERLDIAYRARTYAELEPLTRDLPAAGTTPSTALAHGTPGTGEVASADWPGRIGGRGTSRWAVAIMSGFQRQGHWTVPARFKAFGFWGGGQLDLREARFEEREVVIDCWMIMAGMSVVVPPGVEVDVRGLGIMGGFDSRENGVRGEPGAPKVIIRGFAFWGGVGVERKVTRAEKQRLKQEKRLEKEEKRRLKLEKGED